MTEVVSHSPAETTPTVQETLDFMAKGGEISLGNIPNDERERHKPESYIDYDKAVAAIMDSIRRQGGSDADINANFDSELTEFLIVASVSYDIILQMSTEDATKAINKWHPWQRSTFEFLENSRRVTSVRVTLKAPADDQDLAA